MEPSKYRGWALTCGVGFTITCLIGPLEAVTIAIGDFHCEVNIEWADPCVGPAGGYANYTIYTRRAATCSSPPPALLRNTAYSTILYHEFGHNFTLTPGYDVIVETNEVFADLMSAYFTGSPLLGKDLFGRVVRRQRPLLRGPPSAATVSGLRRGRVRQRCPILRPRRLLVMSRHPRSVFAIPRHHQAEEVTSCTVERSESCSGSDCCSPWACSWYHGSRRSPRRRGSRR